jgi:ApaG protein
MYEAVTHGIRVRVSPEFKSEQSTPEENYYFWTYTVEIINEGAAAMHLRSRVWQITDTRGHREEVRGPGVVGQMPLIPAGERFQYTSGCPLRTPSGIMMGSYQMADEAGKMYDITIPAFSLDSPYVQRRMN